MTPTFFPEANKPFGPPIDMEESQVATVHAYIGEIKRGNLDGCMFVVTAWTPSEEELKELNAGSPVFLTCVGGLPPHFITTNFQNASSIA
jgi:hypothetical protein